ncbi:MAG TPA: NAD(P)-binding protein, partial [Tepidisphaeraceae bacterium]
MTPLTTAHLLPRQRLHRPRALVLYFLAVLHEFRLTLLALALAIALGTVLYRITPQPELNNSNPSVPSLGTSIYGAWMALLAQPIYSPPATWYLTLLCAIYPVFGVLLIGEGIVRFALLMVSRRQGEKEWMRVMASTYRDHVLLCGLGHLGYRVLEQLVASNVPVVVLEREENNRFLAQAKSMGIPVLLRDMKDDQALIDGGVQHAQAVIVATNDDMANLEVALDSRRMNPKIRIIMRLFDQQIASKIAGALTVDVAFSSSALAAPMVAAMSLETRVLGSSMIAGVQHITSEMKVEADSAMAGQRIDELERAYESRVLALTHTPPG